MFLLLTWLDVFNKFFIFQTNHFSCVILGFAETFYSGFLPCVLQIPLFYLFISFDFDMYFIKLYVLMYLHFISLHVFIC